jgi:hypothetical protein
VVVAHELCVIEFRVVCGEEDDAGKEELVVDTFALGNDQYTVARIGREHLLSAFLLRGFHVLGQLISGASLAVAALHWLYTVMLLAKSMSHCLRKRSVPAFVCPMYLSIEPLDILAANIHPW